MSSEPAIRRLLNVDLLRTLADRPGWSVESDGVNLDVWRSKRIVSAADQQVASFLNGKRLRQVLLRSSQHSLQANHQQITIKCARMSLGPRPMYSCSKWDIPLQMAASISPCVFMKALRVGRANAEQRPSALHGRQRKFYKNPTDYSLDSYEGGAGRAESHGRASGKAIDVMTTQGWDKRQLAH
jgi:hypothetical protein